MSTSQHSANKVIHITTSLNLSSQVQVLLEDKFVFDVEKKNTFGHFAHKPQFMGEVLRRQ